MKQQTRTRPSHAPARGRVVARGPAPSGAQYLLQHEDQRVVVTEVGAALRAYSVGDRDVVVPFAETEISPAFHGAVLLPWPNRLGDGSYTFDGTTYQLPVSEPARNVALHGLVAWERWSVRSQETSSVTMRLDLVPTPGYPFQLRSQISYGLSGAGLAVELTTTNIGDQVAPYGVGFHPWLSPGEGALDECTLTVDAGTWVRADERLLPIGREAIPDALDFRQPRLLGATVIDDGFSATHTGDRSWIRLAGPDGRTAAAWMDDTMTSWQVCTGDGIGNPAYDRSGLAAEPMTCVADAFRTGDGLIRLAPGKTHTVRWGLSLT